MFLSNSETTPHAVPPVRSIANKQVRLTMAWKDEEWIGQGRIYATFESTTTVVEQQKLLFSVPPRFDNVRARTDLSVMSLMGRLESVTQGGTAAEVSGRHLFSLEEPNTGLDNLFVSCIVPPSTVIQEMSRSFGQLWFDGKAKSIKDWTKEDVRYPLPALTIYREFDRALETRSLWVQARAWMTRGRQALTCEASNDLAKQLMFAFPWDANLSALGADASVTELFKMLGDVWLTDSHIDMLMQTLTDRLEHNAEASGIVIAPCAFQMYLQLAFAAHNNGSGRAFPVLERYRQWIESGKKAVMYFPGHVNGNHWVAWKISKGCATFGHGE